MTHRDTCCSAGAIAVAGMVALELSQGPVERLDFLGRLAELTVRVEAPFGDALFSLSGWVSLPPEDAIVYISKVGLERKLDEGWVKITPFVVPSVLWSLYSFLRTPDDYWQTIRTAMPSAATWTPRSRWPARYAVPPGLDAIPRRLAGRITDQGS